MHTAPLQPGENAWCWNPITNSNSRTNQFIDTATRMRCNKYLSTNAKSRSAVRNCTHVTHRCRSASFTGRTKSPTVTEQTRQSSTNTSSTLSQISTLSPFRTTRRHHVRPDTCVPSLPFLASHSHGRQGSIIIVASTGPWRWF